VVKQASVSIGWQTALVIIPYGWIYGFYRIEKLRWGLVLVLITVATNITVQTVLPWPFGLIVALGVLVILPIRFIRKWSREWNKKFSPNTS